MADVNYNIILRNETDKGASTPVASTETTLSGGQGTQAGKPLKESALKTSNNDIVSSIVAVQTIKPYVTQAVSFAINNIGIQTGAYETQQRMSGYSQLAGTAASMAAMAASGNVVGVALIGFTTAVNAIQKAAQIEMEKKLEDEQRSLRTSRLGMSTNRSRWR